MGKRGGYKTSFILILLYTPVWKISELDKEGDHVPFPRRGRRRISGSIPCVLYSYLDAANVVLLMVQCRMTKTAARSADVQGRLNVKRSSGVDRNPSQNASLILPMRIRISDG